MAVNDRLYLPVSTSGQKPPFNRRLGRPQISAGSLGEGRNPLPLVGTEPGFLRSPEGGLTTKQTELSRHLQFLNTTKKSVKLDSTLH